MNTATNIVTSAIETVVTQIEKIDSDAQNRPKVYGQDSKDAVATNSQLDRLKVVTGDLLDLWLFEGSKGL